MAPLRLHELSPCSRLPWTSRMPEPALPMPTLPLLVIALLFRFLAQDAGPTNLAIPGAESTAFTNSDTNACFLEDNNSLSAQLTDPSSEMILSLNVLATVGDHPAKDQLKGLTLDGPAEDPFV